jgi:uncharacterized sporulation protein YeaH/YhbH (DUF444 family)
MIRTNSRLNKLVGRVYAEGESGNPAGGKNEPNPSGGSDADKKFTQEDVNKFLAEDRRKHQTNLQTLQQQLEQFKGTAKEKEALQQKLEDLQKQFLTKEQLAQQENEKAKNKYESELKGTAAERDQWRNLFTNTIARTAIAEAAAQNKAFNPTQLELLLRNQVQVKQKTDDAGNPLMQFDVVLPTTVKDKDGKAVTLELSVMDGVKKMRENPDFANLFLVDGTPGTGTTTINNGSTSNASGGPPDEPTAYRAWRENQRKAGRI